MNRELQLKVTNDYIFKKIFAKKGNESILKDLLNSILQIKIKSIEVISDANLERQLESNKLGILDLKAKLDEETIVNIEIQIINRYNMIERTLFYWSGLYYNVLQKGADYKEIKKVIAINILDYNEFEEGPYHEIARLRREYLYKILTDKIEIHFIQIPKFKKQRKDMKTKLDMWMDFISQIDEKEVKNAMSKNKEIKKAQEEYEYLTGDEEERRIAFLREKAIRDENSIFDAGKDIGFKSGEEHGIKKGKKEGIEIGKEQGIEIGKEQGIEIGKERGIEIGREQGIEIGKEQGIEIGKEQGIEQNKKEIANSMLKENIPIETIMKVTKLSREEIEKLEKEM